MHAHIHTTPYLHTVKRYIHNFKLTHVWIHTNGYTQHTYICIPCRYTQFTWIIYVYTHMHAPMYTYMHALLLKHTYPYTHKDTHKWVHVYRKVLQINKSITKISLQLRKENDWGNSSLDRQIYVASLFIP